MAARTTGASTSGRASSSAAATSTIRSAARAASLLSVTTALDANSYACRTTVFDFILAAGVQDSRDASRPCRVTGTLARVQRVEVVVRDDGVRHM